MGSLSRIDLASEAGTTAERVDELVRAFTAVGALDLKNVAQPVAAFRVERAG